jgi:hypothetical protein
MSPRKYVLKKFNKVFVTMWLGEEVMKILATKFLGSDKKAWQARGWEKR